MEENIKPFREQERGTWDGRRIVIKEMDHQHLSNTVHFYTHTQKHLPSAGGYLEEIVKRFSGELLPYRPDPEFDQEIRWLNEDGYLVKREGTTMDYDVVVEGNIIGEVLNIDLGSYYIG